MDPIADVGRQLVDAFGEGPARTLLRVLELPEADRAEFIGHIYQRDDGQALAEILTDIEADPDGITYLWVKEGLRRALQEPG